MPTYDYRCDMCGTEIEEYQTLEEHDHGKKCPVCDSQMVQVISAPGIAPNGLASKKCPAGCVEVGNELDAVRNVKPARREVTDREIQEWARTTTEFQGLPD